MNINQILTELGPILTKLGPILTKLGRILTEFGRILVVICNFSQKPNLTAFHMDSFSLLVKKRILP